MIKAETGWGLITVSTKEALERLWDALSWLDTYDPEAVADMESEFRIDVHTRTVNEHNPREGKDG